ncbi:MAG: hypothetical protein WA971_09305 [Microbacterium sp.]
MRRLLAVGGLALLLFATGCAGGSTGSPGGGSDGYGGGGYGGGGSTVSAVTGLKVSDSPLGKIVVTDSGMTAYRFDDDTQGATKNACTSTVCRSNWTPITVGGGSPSVEGVTGKVVTIAAAGGKQQITLDGWPLYTYNGDAAAGDVKGQGVEGTWWVVDPTGMKITG